MTDDKSEFESTPLDAEWWRQFAAGFMSEGIGETAMGADGPSDFGRKIESVIGEGQKRIRDFLATDRQNVNDMLQNSLERIEARLDRIERRLGDNENNPAE